MNGWKGGFLHGRLATCLSMVGELMIPSLPFLERLRVSSAVWVMVMVMEVVTLCGATLMRSCFLLARLLCLPPWCYFLGKSQ
jgi:hypothetical protein